MKKLTLSLALTALACAGFTTSASAQRYYDNRTTLTIPVPVPAILARDGRGVGRAGVELDRLNREVRQVRLEIGNRADRRIRSEFSRVVRATDRLNYDYNRRAIRGWEVRPRADEIRSDLYRIQRELRFRGRGRDWRQ